MWYFIAMLGQESSDDLVSAESANFVAAILVIVVAVTIFKALFD